MSHPLSATSHVQLPRHDSMSVVSSELYDVPVLVGGGKTEKSASLYPVLFSLLILESAPGVYLPQSHRRDTCLQAVAAHVTGDEPLPDLQSRVSRREPNIAENDRRIPQPTTTAPSPKLHILLKTPTREPVILHCHEARQELKRKPCPAKLDG
ncbi:uncharacterized protein ARMOST_15543 [Armillaria ostoyae]|uniref:Uncharacterized protein n=1 Tax=Armillaria ostoyae TaxID=47428 RepID=A0A284RTS8_ARMOS|nr:uncharacterized protein ARMOST_15543 [Armillaria ostoyae]